MQTYKAPLRDMRFVLHELHGDTRIDELPGCADFTGALDWGRTLPASHYARHMLRHKRALTPSS